MQGEEGFNELRNAIKATGIPTEIVRKGSHIPHNHPAITIDILHPQNSTGSGNPHSAVTLVRFSETVFLFTADIEPEQQDLLIKQSGELINTAQCIQIPHHGGPISKKFIQFFRDRLFVISTGENEWGLPREEQIKQLTGTVMRTDVDGTIVLKSNGTSTTVIRP